MAAPSPMTPEEVRHALERAGLGAPPDDELTAVVDLYHAWWAQHRPLDDFVAPDEEPAVIFRARP